MITNKPQHMFEHELSDADYIISRIQPAIDQSTTISVEAIVTDKNRDKCFKKIGMFNMN